MPPPSPEDAREVEIKLAAASAESARSLLENAGFVESLPRSFESNLVFDTPARDLMHSRRLLRVRSFRGETILTYKGEPESGPHKSRVELETKAENMMQLQRILEALGYELLFRYEKFRASFRRPGESGHAVIDETPIGVFIELEGPPVWIDTTAAELGFARGAYILQSYGSLYREWCETRGITPGHMVFAG